MKREEVLQLLENQRRAALRERPVPVQSPEATDAGEVAKASQRDGAASPPVAPASLSETSLSMWFPLPPSWNRTYLARAMPLKARPGKWTAQVYKSKEAKEYAEQVHALVARHVHRPWPMPVMLRLSAVIAMERAGCDMDDRLKVWLDALQGFVFEDDEQVAEFSNVRRIVDSKRPGITATFEVIDVDRYGHPTLSLSSKQPAAQEMHHDEEV